MPFLLEFEKCPILIVENISHNVVVSVSSSWCDLTDIAHHFFQTGLKHIWLPWPELITVSIDLARFLSAILFCAYLDFNRTYVSINYISCIKMILVTNFSALSWEIIWDIDIVQFEWRMQKKKIKISLKRTLCFFLTFILALILCFDQNILH